MKTGVQGLLEILENKKFWKRLNGVRKGEIKRMPLVINWRGEVLTREDQIENR